MFDYVLTADGSNLSAQSCAPLALLPQADEAVAAVPAQRLSGIKCNCHRDPCGAGLVSPPPKRAVLEDRALDETQQLHCAQVPRLNAEGPV